MRIHDGKRRKIERGSINERSESEMINIKPDLMFNQRNLCIIL